MIAVNIKRFGVWAVLLLGAGAADAASEAPLADAVEKKNFEAIKALRTTRADVNAAQPDGMTALHWAVYHDDVEAAKRLIDAGADAKAANRYGVMPLSLACANGDANIVELLLDAGADPNASLPGGETALMTAARTGRLGPVKALLARGAKVNAKERKGQTALMWAAADGHVDVVDALIEAGADFSTPVSSGFTPFFFAIREGRIDVVRKLLAAGADVNEAMRPAQNNKQGTTPLILAVVNGHFELAAALLEAGADPNARPLGYTALHAITWVRKPIRGDGDPPPMGSGRISSLDFVQRLVAHGADMNTRLERGESGRGRFTTTGSTPFLMAARASDVSLMRLLISLGADPKLPNADGCTPLLAAAGVGALGDGDEAAGTEEEALEAVRVLLELGADVNAADENGETAMHGAAYQSRAELVNLLAENGADVSIWDRKNKWGWTPLLIAEGHRPGNFRPAPETIAAIRRAMLAAGVSPPEEPATAEAARAPAD
ncbi:MAG: ankyrin repeat domain-containing protein [Planctomycetaceae bacterium]|nr:ankyrin repeat domain-containing protein [Planctomycetaceae bacterium]